VRRVLSCAVLCLAGVIFAPQTWAAPKPLQIYFIDAEGGQSTLVVSPSGQSMLIDTGWPGFNGRDVARILAAAKNAGIKKIDYVVITHYHRDHVGGATPLAEKIKIGEFVDHGPNQEDSDITRQDYADYQKLVEHTPHVTLKPGDGIPIKGITAEVVTAAGEHLTSPLPGGGEANPYCAGEQPAPTDDTENARSLGTLITYGKFRFIDLGDLTKKKEIALMCPNNPIGTVDLFLVTHHGFNISNSKAADWALHPRVGIVNNSSHKGGTAEALQVVHDSPGLEDIWQLHYAVSGKDTNADHNAEEKYIANPGADAEDQGFYIKATAEPDGSFTITNARNHFSKTYTK
jgi:competence protein ComEC